MANEKWHTIHSESSDHTSDCTERLRIDGGHLYRVTYFSGARCEMMSVVFVADPPSRDQ